jgi:hypothetical protein
MKDWNNNEIIPGQTIVLIRVKPMFHFADEPPERAKMKLWEIGREYIVKNEGDLIEMNFITDSVGNIIHEGIGPVKIPINFISFYIPKRQGEIICIKGVSDNREEYFKKRIA